MVLAVMFYPLNWMVFSYLLSLVEHMKENYCSQITLDYCLKILLTIFALQMKVNMITCMKQQRYELLWDQVWHTENVWLYWPPFLFFCFSHCLKYYLLPWQHHMLHLLSLSENVLKEDQYAMCTLFLSFWIVFKEKHLSRHFSRFYTFSWSIFLLLFISLLLKVGFKEKFWKCV